MKTLYKVLIGVFVLMLVVAVGVVIKKRVMGEEISSNSFNVSGKSATANDLTYRGGDTNARTTTTTIPIHDIAKNLRRRHTTTNYDGTEEDDYSTTSAEESDGDDYEDDARQQRQRRRRRHQPEAEMEKDITLLASPVVTISKVFKRPKDLPKGETVKYVFSPEMKSAVINLFSKVDELNVSVYGEDNIILIKLKRDGSNLLFHAPSLHETGKYDTVENVFPNTRNKKSIYRIEFDDNTISINHKRVATTRSPIEGLLLYSRQISQIHIPEIAH